MHQNEKGPSSPHAAGTGSSQLSCLLAPARSQVLASITPPATSTEWAGVVSLFEEHMRTVVILFRLFSLEGGGSAGADVRGWAHAFAHGPSVPSRQTVSPVSLWEKR